MNIRNWTQEQIDLLPSIWATGSQQQIEAVFPGKSNHAIAEFARKRGIKRLIEYRKGDVTPLLSEALEAYYWAGFLLADGYIHHPSEQLVAACDAKDLEHLKKFARFIQAEVKIYSAKKSGFRSTSGQQCRVSVRHKDKVLRFAEKFDFKPRKTYNPPDINKLKNILNTKEKFLAFFAGFVDGDGTITDTYLGIENHASWFFFHQFCVDKLASYFHISINTEVRINKRGFSHFRLHGNSRLQVIQIVQKLECPKLTRKWYEKYNFA